MNERNIDACYIIQSFYHIFLYTKDAMNRKRKQGKKGCDSWVENHIHDFRKLKLQGDN